MDHIVDLESCTLKKLKSTGHQIGNSSYCSVHEVEVDGVVCAAKRIFPMLIQSKNDSEGTEKTKRKFVEECILMSKLHHPHILQFIGVYYPSAEDEWYSSCLTYGMTPGLPWLVMENLPFSLEETLLKRPNIPTCIKVSFLLDITKGLLYLHNRDIYHRNLTASNVLITSSMVAKITDFGVAKIFSCQPAALHEYTPLPGNYMYMPPEADQERSGGSASYGNTIDIFSFGVIILFIITQTSPYDLLLLSATYSDPENPRGVKGRTEEERRREHFDIAKRNVKCAEDNKLIELCQCCLLNDPSCRPNAEEILERLINIEKNLASNSTEMWKMDKLELITTLKNKEKMKATDAECPLNQLEEDNTRLHEAQIQVQASRTRAENAEREAQEYTRRAKETEAEEREWGTEWIIERNEIELTNKELGRGGWGTVTVATFRGTRVAAKCFYQELSSDYYQRMFTREMTMAARLRHPNLVQFIGASVEGNVIILTELMTTSLRKELEKLKGPMTQWQITSISLDVARALNYLHLMQPHPIIHRDISSANVLLDPLPDNGWKVKVSDYGSVNLLTCLQTAGPGSPVYAAAEANVPALQTPKMDIFSFGVLLVEMLTHQFPDVNSRQRLIASIDHAGYLALIEECLSEEIDNRPSAQQLLGRLNDMIITL